MQSYWRKKERELNEISIYMIIQREKKIKIRNRIEKEGRRRKRNIIVKKKIRIFDDLIIILFLIYGKKTWINRRILT